MSTYDEIYSTLLRLCKNEGLELIEKNLSNKNIFIWFDKECVIINSGFKI